LDTPSYDVHLKRLISWMQNCEDQDTKCERREGYEG